MIINIILTISFIVFCYWIIPYMIWTWNRNNFRRWLISIYQSNLINKKNNNERIKYLIERIAVHEKDIMNERQLLDNNKKAKMFRITTNKYLTIKKELLNNEIKW